MSYIVTDAVRAALEGAKARHAARYVGRAGAAFEVEARLLPVDEPTFARVLAAFSSRARPVDATTTDVMEGEGWRRTGAELMYKEKLWQHDDAEYGVRLSLSGETRYPPGAQLPAGAPRGAPSADAMTRTKWRRSFILAGGAVRLDATEVRTHRAGAPDATTRELEIEVIRDPTLAALRAALNYLLTIVHDSDIPIPLSTRAAAIAYVRELLGDRRQRPDEEPRLRAASLAQPRDLTMRDLVFGGIVGNRDTTYAVTHKADGLRMLLAFTPWGVFFVAAPKRLNWISTSVVPELTGTLLDGELVPREMRRIPPAERSSGTNSPLEKKHVYFAFDCAARAGDRAVQRAPQTERLAAARVVTEMLGADAFAIPTLTATTKSFFNINSPEEFYTRMAAMVAQEAAAPYETDGFIWSPTMAPYIPPGAALPERDRTLSRAADHVKWKPPEKHSVDLAIAHVSAAAAADGLPFDLAVGGGTRGLVAWRGTARNPFAPTRDSVDMSTNLLREEALPPHGTVVEFRWDGAREMLVPMRIRRDKELPNYEEVAKAVWDNMRDPIPATTLIGADLRQLRQLHNSIKRDVINYLGKARRVLDIGSGNGGDLAKWRNFGHVVAIEPDAAHRDEMRRRARQMGLEGRVTLLAGAGEDIGAALSAAGLARDVFDVATLMLSLSFFYEPGDGGSYPRLDALARGLARHLAPGTGRIGFLTINGDAARRVLAPERYIPLEHAEDRDTGEPFWGVAGMSVKLVCGSRGEETIEIHLPGTIVDRQTEWLVDIEALVAALERAAPGRGWRLAFHERASTGDAALFLPPASALFNRMYSYGVIEQGAGREAPAPVVEEEGDAAEEDAGAADAGANAADDYAFEALPEGGGWAGLVAVRPVATPAAVRAAGGDARLAAAATAALLALDASFQVAPTARRLGDALDAIGRDVATPQDAALRLARRAGAGAYFYPDVPPPASARDGPDRAPFVMLRVADDGADFIALRVDDGLSTVF